MENIINQVKDWSADDLTALSDAIKNILDSKKTVGVAQLEYSGYNGRRYSRPWIARIAAWPSGKPPVLEFGAYYGDDEGGIAEVKAKEGDIIRFGQRDNRGNNTQNCWGVFRDGKVVVIDAKEARKLFNQ